ncbi:fibrinogen C domain-containing protein 1-B-like [Styela clava]
MRNINCDSKPLHYFIQVFQRRIDGSLNFNRNWVDYVAGFGNPQHEFWMGLEQCSSTGNNIIRFNVLVSIRIDIIVLLLTYKNIRYHLSKHKAFTFSIFSIGDASTKYRLNVGGYSGTAGDSLTAHTKQKFSTPDQDNDPHSLNCARNHNSAWWYKNGCHVSNLNGQYVKFVGKYATSGKAYGIEWFSWNNAYCYSMKFVEMKLRPSY